MILSGSYANGFAPRDGRTLYPELWRGCVFAAAPMLGPSGLTLRDWSGFGNHGTLTGVTAASAWTPNRGRYSLSFAGASQYVDTGNSAAFDFATGDFSVCVWVRIATADAGIIGTLSSAPRGWGLYIWSTSPYINWFAYGSTSTNDSRKGPVNIVGDNRWHLVAANYSRVTGITQYLDGINIGNTSTLTGDLSSSQTLQLGRYPISTTFTGQLDDTRIYSRCLSDWEHRLLASRRGIAYELAPRRRSSVQVAAFNRRRRLLVGAGS